jgi:hypothetical protein
MCVEGVVDGIETTAWPTKREDTSSNMNYGLHLLCPLEPTPLFQQGCNVVDCIQHFRLEKHTDGLNNG